MQYDQGQSEPFHQPFGQHDDLHRRPRSDYPLRDPQAPGMRSMTIQRGASSPICPTPPATRCLKSNAEQRQRPRRSTSRSARAAASRRGPPATSSSPASIYVDPAGSTRASAIMTARSPRQFTTFVCRRRADDRHCSPEDGCDGEETDGGAGRRRGAEGRFVSGQITVPLGDPPQDYVPEAEP
jgi:hypothetical protein